MGRASRWRRSGRRPMVPTMTITSRATLNVTEWAMSAPLVSPSMTSGTTAPTITRR